MRTWIVVLHGLSAAGLLFIAATLVLNWLHVIRLSSEAVLGLMILLVVLVFTKPFLTSHSRKVDLDRPHG